MPTLPHELPLELCRDNPALLPELLELNFNLVLPSYDGVRTESADFSQLVPTEFRADFVHHYLTNNEISASLIVEAQLAPDPDKPFAWAVYFHTLLAKTRKPVWLVVITFDEATRRWALKPNPLLPTGITFIPIVIGPSQIPKPSKEQVEKSPQLGVLGVAAHKNDPDALALAQEALSGFHVLDDDRQRLYTDYVLALLAEPIRKQLEAILETGKYQYQSDFAKKYVAIGKAEGEAEGEAKGEARGKAEGKAEGFIAGEISALLKFLSKRGLAISSDEEKTLRACTDLALLDTWLDRALTAQSAHEVIHGKPAPKKRTKR